MEESKRLDVPGDESEKKKYSKPAFGFQVASRQRQVFVRKVGIIDCRFDRRLDQRCVEVEEGSPAEQAGISVNDTVTSVGGSREVSTRAVHKLDQDHYTKGLSLTIALRKP